MCRTSLKSAVKRNRAGGLSGCTVTVTLVLGTSLLQKCLFFGKLEYPRNRLGFSDIPEICVFIFIYLFIYFLNAMLTKTIVINYNF